jgi:hypothetical protein
MPVRIVSTPINVTMAGRFMSLPSPRAETPDEGKGTEVLSSDVGFGTVMEGFFEIDGRLR